MIVPVHVVTYNFKRVFLETMSSESICKILERLLNQLILNFAHIFNIHLKNICIPRILRKIEN